MLAQFRHQVESYLPRKIVCTYSEYLGTNYSNSYSVIFPQFTELRVKIYYRCTDLSPPDSSQYFIKNKKKTVVVLVVPYTLEPVYISRLLVEDSDQKYSELKGKVHQENMLQCPQLKGFHKDCTFPF